MKASRTLRFLRCRDKHDAASVRVQSGQRQSGQSGRLTADVCLIGREAKRCQDSGSEFEKERKTNLVERTRP